MPHKNPEEKKAYLKMYYSAHKDEISAKKKQRYNTAWRKEWMTNPENRKKHNDAARRYRARNKEKVAANRKRYAETHREEIRAMRALYRDKNRQRINAYAREYSKAHRNPTRSWYNAYKAEHPCIYCGEKCIQCLDFHHRDPGEKESNISLLLNHHHTIEELQTEISKCDVVCKNCHAKIHAGLLGGEK